MAAKEDLKEFVDRVSAKLQALRGQELTIDQLASVLAAAEQCSRIVRNLEGIPDITPEDPLARKANDKELLAAVGASVGSSA
jgi:hypothetical protein